MNSEIFHIFLLIVIIWLIYLTNLHIKKSTDKILEELKKNNFRKKEESHG